MLLRRTPLLACLLVLFLLGLSGLTANAQDEKADPYWRQFDERFPEIAGKGETLWDKAAEIAALQIDKEDEDAFATRQNLVFQALAVNERDHAIMRKKAKTKAEHEWILSRRDAARQFEKDVETIKVLRAKADDQLTQSDMEQMLQASVSLMRYIYEAQLQANESYFESVIQENQGLRDKLAEAEQQPEVSPEPETESDPSGSSREAARGDFKAYLQTNRIRIASDDRRKDYDRNHVQISGAIKNQTDKPARFKFQVVALRSNKQVIGLKTIETPTIAPGDVHEIDARMAVEHAAYVRSVDMRKVQVIEP